MFAEVHLHFIGPGHFLRSHVTTTVIVNFLLLWQLAVLHFVSADKQQSMVH